MEVLILHWTMAGECVFANSLGFLLHRCHFDTGDCGATGGGGGDLRLHLHSGPTFVLLSHIVFKIGFLLIREEPSFIQYIVIVIIISYLFVFPVPNYYQLLICFPSGWLLHDSEQYSNFRDNILDGVIFGNKIC